VELSAVKALDAVEISWNSASVTVITPFLHGPNPPRFQFDL
jgi:hypothetical protein